MKATRLLSRGGATAAAGLMAYGTWTAVAWARYGHPRPERHPPDNPLDQFIPLPPEEFATFAEPG